MPNLSLLNPEDSKINLWNKVNHKNTFIILFVFFSQISCPIIKVALETDCYVRSILILLGYMTYASC